MYRVFIKNCVFFPYFFIYNKDFKKKRKHAIDQETSIIFKKKDKGKEKRKKTRFQPRKLDARKKVNDQEKRRKEMENTN